MSSAITGIMADDKDKYLNDIVNSPENKGFMQWVRDKFNTTYGKVATFAAVLTVSYVIANTFDYSAKDGINIGPKAADASGSKAPDKVSIDDFDKYGFLVRPLV